MPATILRSALLTVGSVVAASGCGGHTSVLLGDTPGGADASSELAIPPPDDDAGEIELIDDMEDENDRILNASDGRAGAWFIFNDGTAGAEETPPANGLFFMSKVEPPRGASRQAAHTSGFGFREWASMAMQFSSPPGTPPPVDGGVDTYDASRYTGITFFARVGGGSQTAVRVNLSDVQTNQRGGICTSCFDSFGKNLMITTEWARYRVSFATVAQRGFGDQFAALDSRHLVAIDFNFLGPRPFDLWIDDLAFMR